MTDHNFSSRKGPVALEDDIITLVNEYPLVNTGRPGLYIVRNKDGSKAFGMLQGGCHGGLKSIDVYFRDRYYAGRYGQLTTAEADHMITAFPATNDSEFRYYAWMVNHLYKQYAANFELIDTGIPIPDGFQRPNTGLDAYKCAKGDKRRTFHVIKVDLHGIPANVLFNFLICGRAVIEKNINILLWQRLMDLGVHPAVAQQYMMQMYTGSHYVSATGYQEALHKRTDEKLLSYVNPDFVAMVHGHWPFDNTVKFQNVIDGALKSSHKDFPSGGQLTPTNAIWGNNGGVDAGVFRLQTVAQVSEHYKLPISPVDFTAPLWALDVRVLKPEERTINDEDDARDYA